MDKKVAKVTFKICVIGAGGTGGYFLKEFSRFLAGSDYTVKNLICIDGDIVEEHNLTRQCFMPEDIGKKKASVLCEALTDAFRLEWQCYPYYVSGKDQLCAILDPVRKNEIPIIIGCVDNHGCRLICEEYFAEAKNCIYFDSANEIESGEVVFSYKLNGKQISPLRSEIFPDLKKGDTRNVTELSCEELNTILPQHIATNMLAGNILLSATTSLLEENHLFPGMTCFNSREMTMEYIKLQKEIHE